LRVNNWSSKEKTGTVYYLPSGTIRDIETGKAVITGRNPDGSVIAKYTDEGVTPPKRVWNMKTHNAETYGTNVLNAMIGKRFNYPKSLYAVQDTLRFFVANKPNALIVDFFAGSGTTLHAVNLLNAEDGGHRRCILVTNNEVSADEAKTLSAQGYQPGDPEWEQYGIARYVTWPRTVCSIEGHDVNGKPLKGDYITSGEEPMHMADGFKANAAFFKLGFLDKNAVALGRQFKELLPVLWLKAGAHGPCPSLEEAAEVPAMLVLPENHFAVLTDESQYETFATQVNIEDAITTVYIVTDSEPGYREMISGLHAEDTYQLYRDYLDNFRINHGGR
jgi:adenine-specific DNA-methyltransferase